MNIRRYRRARERNWSKTQKQKRHRVTQSATVYYMRTARFFAIRQRGCTKSAGEISMNTSELIGTRGSNRIWRKGTSQTEYLRQHRAPEHARSEEHTSELQSL